MSICEGQSTNWYIQRTSFLKEKFIINSVEKRDRTARWQGFNCNFNTAKKALQWELSNPNSSWESSLHKHKYKQAVKLPVPSPMWDRILQFKLLLVRPLLQTPSAVLFPQLITYLQTARHSFKIQTKPLFVEPNAQRWVAKYINVISRL